MSGTAKREESANWPGIVEHVFIFLMMPLAWIALLVVGMIALWGASGTAGILEGLVGGALSVTVLFYAVIQYNRTRELRKEHWDGLLYRPVWRWCSIISVIVVMLIIPLLLRNSEPEGPKFEEQAKSDAIQKEFWASNSSAFEDPKTSTEGRGNIAMKGDAKSDKSNIVSVSLYPSSKPTQNQPPTNMFFYFSPGTSDATKKTVYTTVKRDPELFVLDGLPIPIKLIATIFGLGGKDVSYRDITLKTISQTIHGDKLNTDTFASVSSELAKNPQHIASWNDAAMNVIKEAKVSGKRWDEAVKQIDDIVESAKKESVKLDEDANKIVVAIKKAVKEKPNSNKPEIDIVAIAANNNGHLTPQLKDRVRLLLVADDDGKACLKAWDTIPPPATVTTPEKK